MKGVIQRALLVRLIEQVAGAVLNAAEARVALPGFARMGGKTVVNPP